MSTTDGTETKANTNAATDDAMALRLQRLNAGQRRLNQGLWIFGRVLEVFGGNDNDGPNQMTWREASGKPPRQRRSARRRNPAD